MSTFPIFNTFQRVGSFPITDTEVFDTIASLQDYALNNPTAYAGQQCVVKGNPSSAYIINENKTIKLVSLVIGESSNTAYRGDRGKIAYEHSQLAHAPANAQPNSDITPEEVADKLPSNILLNDGSTQMAVTLTYTPIGTVYEAEGDFSTINVNNIRIGFNWDVRGLFSIGDYLKLYSSTLTDIYYVQITQIYYISEYFITLNYLNIPNFKSNVINRAVKVIRNEFRYTPVEDLDLATKEYVDSKSVTYTNSTPVQQAVGGIVTGQTFTNNSMKEMFDFLIYAYLYPLWTNCNYILLNNNSNQNGECGNTISGNIRFIFAISNTSNVTPNTLIIKQSSIVKVNNNVITSPIEFELTNITRGGEDGTYEPFTLEFKNTKDETIVKNINIYFYYPTFYGVGGIDLSSVQIQGLSKVLEAKSNKQISFTTNDNYAYFAYLKSRGSLISIIDIATNFEYIDSFEQTTMSFTIGTVNPETVDYYVYRLKNKTTSVITFNFKFN